MSHYLRQFRLFVFGPRSVDSVMASFKAAAEDLRETQQHHRIHAENHRDLARLHTQAAGRHEASAQRAARFGDRIDAFLS